MWRARVTLFLFRCGAFILHCAWHTRTEFELEQGFSGLQYPFLPLPLPLPLPPLDGKLVELAVFYDIDTLDLSPINLQFTWKFRLHREVHTLKLSKHYTPSQQMASARALPDSSPLHPKSPFTPSLPPPPTNDDIEAVIQMATSSIKSQDSRPSAPLRDTRTQLFVGNLPYRVRWQDLKDLFRRAGTVLRADVSLGPDNRSRGYGNVLLATAEDAGRAIDMLNGYCWQTRVLEVRPDRFGASVDEMGATLAMGGANEHCSGFSPAGIPYDEITFGHDLIGSGTGMKTLFVGNLPFHIQWQDLKDLFRAAGAVARADVALGLDGRSRGFGTVSFVTEDGAERARRMFDGYEFNGRQLKVHYDKFSPSATPVPLVVGVPSSLPSTLSQYDALASHIQSLQLESLQLGRQQYEYISQPTLDALSHSQLDISPHPQLDPFRRADLDLLSSSQLESLLVCTNALSGSRGSNPSLGSSPPTSASLTTPSPAILHSQSLAPTTAHSLAPTPTHPHSLTSSPHLGLANTNSTGFASVSLPLGSELKLPSHSIVSKNADSLSLKLNADMKLGSDVHQLSLNKNISRTSSFSSPRPTSQAQSYTTASSGSSRPSFSTASPLADGRSLSQRPSFGASQSQRPSFSSSTSQRPSFGGALAQHPLFNASSVLNGPFLDDVREGQGPVSHPVSLGTTRVNSGSSSGASSLPPGLVRPTSGMGYGTVSPSPPASGGWPSMSIPRQTSPVSMLAYSTLDSDSSKTSQSVWCASKDETSRRSTPLKAEGSGNADAIATALGSLGMRRPKVHTHRIAEKDKRSSPDQKPTTSSAKKATSSQRPSQSSSRRQPGPIALPPPCAFTLPHLPVLSPHLAPHPQSPMYHASYGSPHPVSPLYHPSVNSSVHHPAISPLHHPSVHAYHHQMHYGVLTPHGLPPITPSMPPFTFLQPQPKMNGRSMSREGPRTNTGNQQGQGGEVRREVSPPSSPYHTASHSQVPYSPHLPPHMFSPGIPLSPGVMMPLSPGYRSSLTMVPLTPGGVQLPMTPGVTMTPGGFWPQAPWMNPAPGAPVHTDEHRHNHGYAANTGGYYFRPEGGLDDDTGYFPPVYSVANEIFKEGSEFNSSAREDESRSSGSSGCVEVVSPVPDSTQMNGDRASAAHGIIRTTSVHNNGKGSGTPKRVSLTHRPESDPIVPSLCSSSGERQS